MLNTQQFGWLKLSRWINLNINEINERQFDIASNRMHLVNEFNVVDCFRVCLMSVVQIQIASLHMSWWCWWGCCCCRLCPSSTILPFVHIVILRKHLNLIFTIHYLYLPNEMYFQNGYFASLSAAERGAYGKILQYTENELLMVFKKYKNRNNRNYVSF